MPFEAKKLYEGRISFFLKTFRILVREQGFGVSNDACLSKFYRKRRRLRARLSSSCIKLYLFTVESLLISASCILKAVYHYSRFACAGGANMFQLLLRLSNLSVFCLLSCARTRLEVELHDYIQFSWRARAKYLIGSNLICFPVKNEKSRPIRS